VGDRQLCQQEETRIGVGALVFRKDGKVLMTKRGPRSRNEAGAWEFPGGEVETGEELSDAVCREIREETGIEISLGEVLGTFDHEPAESTERWITITYIADIISGTAKVMEPGKCTEIGWFYWHDLPAPLTTISEENVKAYDNFRRQQS